MKTPVRPAKDGVNISIYVQPGASESAWCGRMGDSLKLRIAARPIEGEANKAVCTYIANFLGIAKSNVSVSRGDTGRQKTIHVAGDSVSLMAKFAPLIGDLDT